MTEAVYACNEGYLDQTIISVISLLKYHPSVKVHLIADHIEAKKIDRFVCKVSDYTEDINIIPIEHVLGNLKFSEQDRHPKTIYAKLFLAEVLSCDKALYIDSDIVINGSLEELLNRDMTEELAAGVIMPYSRQIKERLGLSAGDPYICDGMVLLNLDAWRVQKISEQCRRYISECQGEPYMLSEGVLNHVCRGKMGVLEPAYNLMPSMIFFQREQIIQIGQSYWYYTREQLEQAKEAPKMIHFMKELYNRPWFEPCDHPYADYYRSLDKEIFGCERAYNRVNVSVRTRVNKWLYRMLPFGWYLGIYKKLKKRQ